MLFDFLKDLIQYSKERKRYFAVMVMFIFSLFGVVLIFAEGSAISPFVYALF